MKIFGISFVTILAVLAVWYVGRKTKLLAGTFPPITG